MTKGTITERKLQTSKFSHYQTRRPRRDWDWMVSWYTYLQRKVSLRLNAHLQQMGLLYLVSSVKYFRENIKL